MEVCKEALNRVKQITEANNIRSDLHIELVKKYNTQKEFRYIDGNIKTSIPNNIEYLEYAKYIPLTIPAGTELKQKAQSAKNKDIYHFSNGIVMDKKFCNYFVNINHEISKKCISEFGDGYRARGNQWEDGNCWSGPSKWMKCGRGAELHEKIQSNLQNVINGVDSTVLLSKPLNVVLAPLGTFVCQDCRNIISADNIKNSTITIDQINKCESIVNNILPPGSNPPPGSNSPPPLLTPTRSTKIDNSEEEEEENSSFLIISVIIFFFFIFFFFIFLGIGGLILFSGGDDDD